MEKFKELSEEAWQLYLLHVSIDCVVFGFHDFTLKVLLLKGLHDDSWALPGGYIGNEEDIDDSAIRTLKERTGAENIYLEQFRAFGSPNRSEHYFSEFPDTLWHKQRFVTIGYYALVDYTLVLPKPDSISSSCEWKDIENLPSLIMDHKYIIDQALTTLRMQLSHKPIGYSLLPDKFTMPELQKLYEIILGKKLNRGNFYRKMMGYDILDKLDESRKSGGAHKSPNLYRFNKEKYENALSNGLKESW
ncbi:NUDIX domain-containing protein [Pontibacter silvestris]|uniref:NUDIX domain-containing protein n=2 Tax=Pontibacter silvestris TaxID=2305183 RepID=A0ABW4WZV0_9BACT|nr:NUDIX domain-containing protein [Pontibacter silvestris]MCC9138457.1 NUDIX domain-containing protein [Pontibacter silvestris]